MAETSVSNYQAFNNTDGGLFCSYVNKNNAKVATALRRIFPSPGCRRAQSIELIESGNLEGGILCSAPGVFSIGCGEKPTGVTWDDRGIGGIWYAENGDIVLHAPKGRVRIVAEGIDLISKGDPQSEKGGVNVAAPDGAFEVKSNNIIMEADETVSIDATGKIQISSISATKIEGGEVEVTEGDNALIPPGSGAKTVLQDALDKAKMVGKFLK
tara:strand:- start:652 stop:1290 length:639 start_codon:yes stop_codon:yes gene_type:complete